MQVEQTTTVPGIEPAPVAAPARRRRQRLQQRQVELLVLRLPALRLRLDLRAGGRTRRRCLLDLLERLRWRTLHNRGGNWESRQIGRQTKCLSSWGKDTFQRSCFFQINGREVLLEFEPYWIQGLTSLVYLCR